MTVTLKNFELNQIMDVLGSITEQDSEDIKVSYRVGKIMKALSEHASDFERTRKEIVKSHAEKDEDGNLVPAKNEKGEDIEGSVQLNPDTQAKYKTELMDLLDEELEINIPVSLSIEDLFDAGIKLKPHRVVLLEPILDGGDD